MRRYHPILGICALIAFAVPVLLVAWGRQRNVEFERTNPTPSIVGPALTDARPSPAPAVTGEPRPTLPSTPATPANRPVWPARPAPPVTTRVLPPLTGPPTWTTQPPRPSPSLPFPSPTSTDRSPSPTDTGPAPPTSPNG